MLQRLEFITKNIYDRPKVIKKKKVKLLQFIRKKEKKNSSRVHAWKLLVEVVAKVEPSIVLLGVTIKIGFLWGKRY